MRTVFFAALGEIASHPGYRNKFYSNNGKNIVVPGAELLVLQAIPKFAHSESLKGEVEVIRGSCTFIPTNTPHFSWFWESGIKIAEQRLWKFVGKKMLFSKSLLLSFAKELFRCSRPQNPLSDDPCVDKLLIVARLPFKRLNNKHVGKNSSKATDSERDPAPVMEKSKTQSLITPSRERWSRKYANFLRKQSRWEKETF